MGACVSDKKSMKEKTTKIEGRTILPKAYYLHRSTATLFEVTDRTMTKQKIKCKDSFPSDSGIGLLSETQILLAGGTNLSGALVTKVLEINLESQDCIKYPNLLKPMKLGNLIPHSSWVYYAGGLSIKDKSPLYRFDTKRKKWEQIRIKKELGLKFLQYPGTFLLGDKIMFVGGQWSSKNNDQANEDTFSIDLTSLIATKEDVKMLPSLNGMVGSNGNTESVLLGGWDLSTSTFNKRAYRITLDLKVEEISSIPWNLNENYPVFYSNCSVVASSHPKIAIFHENKWESFELDSSIQKATISSKPEQFEESFKVDAKSDNEMVYSDSIEIPAGEKSSEEILIGLRAVEAKKPPLDLRKILSDKKSDSKTSPFNISEAKQHFIFDLKHNNISNHSLSISSFEATSNNIHKKSDSSSISEASVKIPKYKIIYAKGESMKSLVNKCPSNVNRRKKTEKEKKSTEVYRNKRISNVPEIDKSSNETSEEVKRERSNSEMSQNSFSSSSSGGIIKKLEQYRAHNRTASPSNALKRQKEHAKSSINVVPLMKRLNKKDEEEDSNSSRSADKFKKQIECQKLEVQTNSKDKDEGITKYQNKTENKEIRTNKIINNPPKIIKAHQKKLKKQKETDAIHMQTQKDKHSKIPHPMSDLSSSGTIYIAEQPTHPKRPSNVPKIDLNFLHNHPQKQTVHKPKNSPKDYTNHNHQDQEIYRVSSAESSRSN